MTVDWLPTVDRCCFSVPVNWGGIIIVCYSLLSGLGGAATWYKPVMCEGLYHGTGSLRDGVFGTAVVLSLFSVFLFIAAVLASYGMCTLNEDLLTPLIVMLLVVSVPSVLFVAFSLARVHDEGLECDGPPTTTAAPTSKLLVREGSPNSTDDSSPVSDTPPGDTPEDSPPDDTPVESTDTTVSTEETSPNLDPRRFAARKRGNSNKLGKTAKKVKRNGDPADPPGNTNEDPDDNTNKDAGNDVAADAANPDNSTENESVRQGKTGGNTNGKEGKEGGGDSVKRKSELNLTLSTRDLDTPMARMIGMFIGSIISAFLHIYFAIVVNSYDMLF